MRVTSYIVTRRQNQIWSPWVRTSSWAMFTFTKTSTTDLHQADRRLAIIWKKTSDYR